MVGPNMRKLIHEKYKTLGGDYNVYDDLSEIYEEAITATIWAKDLIREEQERLYFTDNEERIAGDILEHLESYL